MKSLNTIGCIKFEKRHLKISVVDLLSKKVVWQKSLTCDFDVIDNAGTLINPVRIGSFLQKSTNEVEIPKRFKVSLGLEFLSLNSLILPAVSGEDFERIVIDEAKRESPFSYTNEKIGVAYQVLQDKIIENGAAGTQVLAATTPLGVIDSIVEAFRNTSLTLETISPSLLGLKHYLLQQKVDLAQPFILIFISSHNAELYIWQGWSATSYHFIRLGSNDLESLQKEITVSLEHFNHNSGRKFISRVIVAGERCPIELDSQYTVEYLAGDGWSDLFGLAMVSEADKLNFITETQQVKGASNTQGNNKFWLVMLGGIILLNVPISWGLWSAKQQLAKVNNENIRLQETLNAQIDSMEAKKRNDPHYKIHILLEDIRGIVSNDIMFDRLILDLEKRSMQLEGFCLGQNTLNYFIHGLSRIEGVKSIERIQMVEQTRGNLRGYVFSFQINLNANAME